MALTPGANLTSRNRLAQMLMQQEQGAPPIQAHSQGLASMLRQGLAGYMQGADMRDLLAAQKAMATPVGQQPQPLAPGMQGPPQAPQPLYGGRQKALAELLASGNEYAGMALPQVAQQQEAYDIGQQQLQQAQEFQRQMRATPDAPLSPEAYRQKLSLAAAGRPVWAQTVDPSGIPVQINRTTGEVRASPGAKPLTQDQANAALFADRMAQSDMLIRGLSDVAVDPAEVAKGSVPFIGNYLVSGETQSLEQAKRDFINATLRRESGAAISQGEFANAEKQYFPVLGDTPETIAQKERNRATAVKGITRAAGQQYQLPGDWQDVTRQQPQMSGEDQDAYDWATANPNDPRAQVILQGLGGR